MALLLLLPSLISGAIGAALVVHVHAMVPPDQIRPRAVPGTVVDLIGVPCFRRGGRPTQTCFRSIVDYEDAGRASRVESRKAYHPAKHARDQKVEVLLAPDGTAFIDVEWETRQAELMRDFRSARNFPGLMGWLLLGGGALGLLFSAALIFFVDRSGKL
jgi:hypothetical protein